MPHLLSANDLLEYVSRPWTVWRREEKHSTSETGAKRHVRRIGSAVTEMPVKNRCHLSVGLCQCFPRMCATRKYLGPSVFRLFLFFCLFVWGVIRYCLTLYHDVPLVSVLTIRFSVETVETSQSPAREPFIKIKKSEEWICTQEVDTWNTVNQDYRRTQFVCSESNDVFCRVDDWDVTVVGIERYTRNLFQYWNFRTHEVRGITRPPESDAGVLDRIRKWKERRDYNKLTERTQVSRTSKDKNVQHMQEKRTKLRNNIENLVLKRGGMKLRSTTNEIGRMSST